MKCGACRGNHKSVAEVKSCFAGESAFARPCKHGLPPLQCSLEHRKHFNWSKEFRLKYPTKCCFCRGWMEEGEKACKRFSRIAHRACVEEPALMLPPTTMYWMDGDALGIPDYGNLVDSVQRLFDAASELLGEATAIALEATDELFESLEEDIPEIWLLAIEARGDLEEDDE